jgi:hypothetical protein
LIRNNFIILIFLAGCPLVLGSLWTLTPTNARAWVFFSEVLKKTDVQKYINWNSRLNFNWELFTKTCEIHRYNTRAAANKNFYINSSRLEIPKRSFSRFGSFIWNSISPSFRAQRKHTFKTKLNKTLMTILQKENDHIDLPLIINRLPIETKPSYNWLYNQFLWLYNYMLNFIPIFSTLARFQYYNRLTLHKQINWRQHAVLHVTCKPAII